MMLSKFLAFSLVASTGVLIPTFSAYAQQCLPTAISVDQDPSTLNVFVSGPLEMVDELPKRGQIRVSFVVPSGRDTSIQGTIVYNRNGVMEIKTTQRLPSARDPGTQVVFSSHLAKGRDCIEQWIGDCFGSFCAGTGYCLPGHGPGGFDCRCV